MTPFCLVRVNKVTNIKHIKKATLRGRATTHHCRYARWGLHPVAKYTEKGKQISHRGISKFWCCDWELPFSACHPFSLILQGQLKQGLQACLEWVGRFILEKAVMICWSQGVKGFKGLYLPFELSLEACVGRTRLEWYGSYNPLQVNTIVCSILYHLWLLGSHQWQPMYSILQ